jgi:hypothetical protein
MRVKIWCLCVCEWKYRWEIMSISDRKVEGHALQRAMQYCIPRKHRQGQKYIRALIHAHYVCERVRVRYRAWESERKRKKEWVRNRVPTRDWTQKSEYNIPPPPPPPLPVPPMLDDIL